MLGAPRTPQAARGPGGRAIEIPLTSAQKIDRTRRPVPWSREVQDPARRLPMGSGDRR